MNTPHTLIGFLAFALHATTTWGQVPIAARAVTESSPQYVITETGPHHQIWSTVTWQTNEAGIVEGNTNVAYNEIATGLNYINTNNQWAPADEQIDLLDSGM